MISIAAFLGYISGSVLWWALLIRTVLAAFKYHCRFQLTLFGQHTMSCRLLVYH